MTGYAKRQCVLGEKKITVEIKTLNSKQMDVNTKLPFNYRDKDLEIRSMLNRLERGKMEFILTEEADTAAATSQLNHELVEIRFKELRQLADEIHQATPSETLLECVLKQSDVWATAQDEGLSDEDWSRLSSTIQEAIDDVDKFRIHEGNVLKQDFVKHIDLIEQKSKEIPQYESERIETAKERIRKYIADFNIKEVDENRFEQELIYYLEKLDITEEKIRLSKHIDYFRHTMDEEEGSGKKLGFIVQEMGREINTTGSKSNLAEMQNIVVRMKDELEQIKEQVLNVM